MRAHIKNAPRFWETLPEAGLFSLKLAAEMDMVMNVLAAGMEIPDEQLEQLRGHCIQDAKKTNGSVTLEREVRFQDRRDD